MYAKIETKIRFFVLNITMSLLVRWNKRIVCTFYFFLSFYNSFKVDAREDILFTPVFDVSCAHEFSLAGFCNVLLFVGKLFSVARCVGGVILHLRSGSCYSRRRQLISLFYRTYLHYSDFYNV